MTLIYRKGDLIRITVPTVSGWHGNDSRLLLSLSRGNTMTTTPDFRALCAELVDEIEGWIAYGDEADCADAHAVVDRARAALATPPPEPPSDAELKEWYHQWAKSTSWWGHGDRPVHFARAVLERWGR